MSQESETAELAQPDLSAVPTGAWVRSTTRAVRRGHSGAPVSELLGDVYTYVFTGIIAIVMAVTVAGRVGTGFHLADAGPAVLDPSWLGPIAAVALVGAILGVIARLGPLGVGPAGATWWLPMPVDRASLIRGSAIGWILAVTALGGVGAGVLVSLVPTTTPALVVVAIGLLIGANLVLALSLTQTTTALARRRARRIASVGDVMLLVAPLCWIVLAITRPQFPLLAALPGIAVVLILAVAATVQGIALFRRLEHIQGITLREQGARAAYVGGAVVSLDAREVGRALTDVGGKDSRRRLLAFSWVTNARTAIVAADLTFLLRTPRNLAQVIALAALPAAAAASGLAAPWLVTLLLLMSGYGAALACTAGARAAQAAPVLDRVLPLSAKEIRRVRHIAPILVMVLWSVIAFGAVGLGRGDVVGWANLGIVAGPALACGALRASYRPEPDWSGPLVQTPGGAIPSGVVANLLAGPVLVIFTLIPTMIAGFASVGPIVVLAQIPFTLIAYAVSQRVPKPKSR